MRVKIEEIKLSFSIKNYLAVLKKIFDGLMRGTKSYISILTLSILLCVAVATVAPAQKDSTGTSNVNFSIYPVFGYQPETNFTFGVISFFVYDNATNELDEFYRPSTISPYVLYTLNNQSLIAIDFDSYFKRGFYLDIKPRYYNFPDFFFGIGNDNKVEDEEIYTNEFVRLDGRLMKFINKWWSAGLRFDYQNNNLYDFEEDGVLINGDIFGVEGGLNSGFGPSTQIDTRDNILYPSKGVYAQAELTFYSDIFGGDFNYTLFLIDLRKYISIKNTKNILAFQAAANFTSGNQIPFYNLQKVGGDKRLRGIENSRLYLDKQSVWVQAEYRRKLFWRFGATAFAGFGDVAPGLSKFNFDELKYVVGLGGRFQAMKEEKLNIRLDAGVGRGGQYAFYLSVKEAF
ncbi:MAG: outer membrane protein assembly factor [Cytophagales bacterium]|nr:outer membrane protein assembly factor [Cytophagales bacterium]